MMTGILSRGQTPTGGAACNSNGNVGGMTPMMMQMMILPQILQALREPLAEMTRHTDMLGSASSDSQRSTSSAETPPSMPERYKRCPSCNGNVMRATSVCPICGYRF